MKPEVTSVPVVPQFIPTGQSVSSSAARRVPLPAEVPTKPVAIVEDTSRLRAALDKATSTLWSSRVDCFLDIRHLISTSSISLDNPNTTERIMKLCIEHINDPHHKVNLECLETIKLLVTSLPSTHTTFCEKFVPLLFKKLLDTKESIKNISSAIIDITIRKFEIESINQVFFKVLEQNHSKIKLLCLEYFSKIITLDTSNYLFNLIRKISIYIYMF
jgi:hypothetical protein